MNLPDAHRHGAPLSGTVALAVRDLSEIQPQPTGPWCVGLHPWHLAQERLESDLCGLETALALPNVVALGECGLDRACDVPWDLQLRAFEAQLALAHSHDLPVVLHGVRANSELLRHRKSAKTPWLWHGFQGSPELANDLWRHGIALSFGAALLASAKMQSAFVSLPPEAVLLESDMTEIDMLGLYVFAAALRNLDASELAKQVRGNLRRIGISLPD